MYALSDPVRVAIYTDIVGADCAQNCSAFLKVREKKIPKATLSLHFRLLREAGLIRSERRGREMHNTSRCSEVDELFPGLIRAIVNAHVIQMNGKANRKPGNKTKSSKRKVSAAIR